MFSTNSIEGSAYSCKYDENLLKIKEIAIASAKKNNSNPLELKRLQENYESSKKKYDESPCGKDVETDNCIALQAQISSMQSLISYLRYTRDDASANSRAVELGVLTDKFSASNCSDKIGGFRAGVVNSISGTFQALDKLRIEEQSKYQSKKRIFFGAIVLAGAILIITMFGKKK